MTQLHREVSAIVGYTIPKGKYASVFKLLEVEGRLTIKHVNEILALILSYLENQEEEKDES